MIEVNETDEIACAVCSTGIDSDSTFTTVNDDIVCEDCFRICENCQDVYSTDDDMNYVDNSQVWCQDCVESYAHWCESCEIYTTNGVAYVRDRGAYWCSDSCISDAYYCEDCDEYYADGCENCVEDSRVIHDYSYRPDAIFHSTDKNERLYFGIEIEVEAGRKQGEAAEYAHQLESMDLAYLKHDGSLNCGFEVVTHPMSHSFFKHEASDFFRVIEGLRTEHKVKSWDTSTCGLHIHISRAGFNGGAHMHRFLNLIYSNQALYETLAGRQSDQWAKFTDILSLEWTRDSEGNRTDLKTTRSFKHKLNGRNSDRYSAVNTQNSATLEMRIFRGTVNGNTIKAHIDLAHASVEYTRTMTVKNILNDGALEDAKFLRYISDNAELYPDLLARVTKLLPNILASATI